MRNRVLGWCLFCALGFGPPALGAGAERSQPPALSSVPGLDQRVTFTETKIPLGELIQKVAAATGVPLTAAPEVADQPVAVVVKELPARELLEELADLLDYQWHIQAFRRSGVQAFRGDKSGRAFDLASPERLNAQDHRFAAPGTGPGPAARPGTGPALRAPAPSRPPPPERPAAYEIWQDLAARQREEALREAVFAQVETRFREELARYLAIAALPQDQIVPLLQEPGERAAIARQLWSPINRVLVSLLGQLSAAQWALLREQGQLTFSTDPSHGEQPLPAEIARVFEASQPSLGPPGLPSPLGDRNDPESIRRLEREMQEQWAAAAGYRVTVSANTNRWKTAGALSLLATAEPIQVEPSSRPSPSFDFREGGSLLLTTEPLDLRQPPLTETLQHHAEMANDPVLGAAKRFQREATPPSDRSGPQCGSSKRLPDLLPELARTYGVCFISDAYWSAAPISVDLSATTEPTTLLALLERYASPTFQWDRRGHWVRLRSRTWFFDRPREIPLRVVRRWKQLADQYGALPLEEYLQSVASLNDAQLESLPEILEEAGLPPDLRTVAARRQVLRLYASLTPAQRQALWQESIIPLAQMSPGQQRLFLAAWQEAGGSVAPPCPAGWAAAGLSITRERFIRTVDRRGGSTQYGLEFETIPTEPVPRAAVSAVTSHGVTRHPITELQFQFQWGPEVVETVGLVVASTPPEVANKAERGS